MLEAMQVGVSGNMEKCLNVHDDMQCYNGSQMEVFIPEIF